MMFTQFFGLKRNPFSKEVPFDRLFTGRDLTELASRLKYLQQVRGIGLLIGEAGCGKTTALRKFVSELNPAHFKPCYFALSTVTVLNIVIYLFCLCYIIFFNPIDERLTMHS